MSDKSKIEWTDASWNIVTGCTRASPGCDFCYAVRTTKRLAAMGQEKYKGLVNEGKDHFNGVVKTHERLLKVPLSWREPRKVFVCSMSDLFHKDVPFDFIDKAFAVMALCPQHVFQILTKRPERMADYLNTPFRNNRVADAFMGIPGLMLSTLERQRGNTYQSLRGGRLLLDNVWLGTSVENQATADERIPHLLKCPASVRWLSCEPLLGAVDLSENGTLYFCPTCDELGGGPGDMSICGRDDCRNSYINRGIDWVVVGGESGAGARPMHPDWARDLRDDCKGAGIPYFFKQWGKHVPVQYDGGHWFHNPDHKNADPIYGDVTWPSWKQVVSLDGVTLAAAGKHAAGRHLDRRTWDQYPDLVTA